MRQVGLHCSFQDTAIANSDTKTQPWHSGLLDRLSQLKEVLKNGCEDAEYRRNAPSKSRAEY